MTIEELIGQTLSIGIPGTKITPDVVRHFKELNAGGLILYRINFESPVQLKKLISDLEMALGRNILVMADHEGGRVIMFRDGVTVFPDSWAIGQTGKTKYARMQGEIEAKELRRLGIDVNLGPVLDILTGVYSPNIGIRSYGRDWKMVTEMGLARIQGMQKGGVSACAKHFPGKGHAPVDAHIGLPTIRSTWEEMEAVHLRPFIKTIEAGIDMVMTSHPYYPDLDSNPKNIATFSRKIVHDYLRRKLKYDGVICSDDLEMGAIKEICPLGEAAVRAMNAGHDILLVCHDLNAQKEVYRALAEAYRTGKCSKEELEASVNRIQKLKAKRKKRFEGGPPRVEPEGPKIVHSICEQGVRFFNESHNALLPDLKNKKVFVIFPKFSSLAQKIMIEKEVMEEKKFVLKEFGRFGVKPSVQVVGIEPNDSEIMAAIEQIKKSEVSIYFCFDAHLYPSNKKLLNEVQNASRTAVIGFLRDPYDIELLKPSIPALTCGGWRACQIRPSLSASPNNKKEMSRQNADAASLIQSVGIDRGGSWLRIAAVDRRGKTLKAIQVPSPSLTDLPHCIKSIFQRWKVSQVPILIIGSKGVWTRAEKHSLKKKLEKLAQKTLVLSDVELAHHRYFKGRNGVLLIAGTGSIAYGRNKNEIARSGGLGPEKGDEGSGYWIGRRWLQILRMNGNKTGEKKSVRETAQLAGSVIDKAEKGETYPFFIAQEAADYLAKLVWDASGKLNLKGTILLGCHGGLFKNRYLERELLKALPFYFPGQKIKTASSREDAATCAARMGLDGSWKKYLGTGNPLR